MRIKAKKQKPFKLTVFVNSKQLGVPRKVFGHSVVDVEQVGPDLYRMVLVSTDWRWLVRVVEFIASRNNGSQSSSHPPILEYLGPYSTT